MSFTDHTVTGSTIINGNTGSGGSEYVVSCGVGVTGAELISSLGIVEYTFTAPESRGIFIPAGSFTINAEGSGTVRIEAIRNR